MKPSAPRSVVLSMAPREACCALYKNKKNIALVTGRMAPMVNDFDEDDEDAWAVHNSQGWYVAVFATGVIVAVVLAYFF
ncbi:hypothetical protein CU100_02620 [Phyllobacterium endophyticum]|uniref:Uncharacterized protein n=1 Tax=Phyllobacterium endophyticum TaxID=1149773 RepID=A0A2P7AZP5_9HYPH|nr:hypothetical protein CU100_02620 [Phyllobacterium endophyticum]